MTQFRFVGTHADSLASGAVVGPGEFVELDDEQVKENKRLFEDSLLIEVPEVDKQIDENSPDRPALLAEARELGVEGNLSKMRNDQLQTAINHKKEEGS